MQKEWSEEDEREIEYLNRNYFNEKQVDDISPMRTKDERIAKKQPPGSRKTKIVVTHPDGYYSVFDQKVKAQNFMRISYMRLQRAIETGEPLIVKGWEGCTVEEILPAKRQAYKSSPVNAIAPNGQAIYYERRKDAMKEIGCSNTAITKSIQTGKALLRGSGKGWRFEEVKINGKSS